MKAGYDATRRSGNGFSARRLWQAKTRFGRQSDLLNNLDIVVLCPVTSELRSAAFRVTLEPNPTNGLRVLTQVMVDKLSILPRAKIGAPFGHLDDDRMKAVERALLLVIGVI